MTTRHITRQPNELAKYLLTHRISGDEFAHAAGIERTRAHRLIWSDTLARSMRVDELKRIATLWPDLAAAIL